jgi:hypothetical protein
LEIIFANASNISEEEIISEKAEKVNPDEQFFSSLDYLVKQFAISVSNLKSAKNEDRKADYVTLATMIYTKIDSIVYEIKEYYLFKNLPKANVGKDGKQFDPNEFSKCLNLFISKALGASEYTIKLSKVASVLFF